MRLTKGNEVYAVDGFLSMTMGQGFDAYRNKEILAVNKADLTQISINTQGTTTILQKGIAYWTQDGTTIDSTTITNYLTGLQSISGVNFVNDFDDIQNQSLLYKTLSLEGNNIASPILIKAYRDTARAEPYIIQSSLNDGSYFASDADGVFGKLFGSW